MFGDSFSFHLPNPTIRLWLGLDYNKRDLPKMSLTELKTICLGSKLFNHNNPSYFYIEGNY